MSESNTYVVLVARSVDILLCGWIWRTYDVTISSMCGLALRMPRADWRHAIDIWLQQQLGAALNWLQSEHCEAAIAADSARARATLKLLS